jgi:eukaryotic-like serine/threonine-protein kinase
MKAARLNGDDVLHIAIPVAGALAAAHAIDVIHRDIKPANLFLTRDGQVKVLDFGLAKVGFRPSIALGEDAPTMATFATLPGTRLGTLAYMSPEQVRCEPVDARADLYSLGVVLHEGLTGSLPVRGAPSGALPQDLAPMICRLIEMDRLVRYQTAAELLADLIRIRHVKAHAQSAG